MPKSAKPAAPVEEPEYAVDLQIDEAYEDDVDGMGLLDAAHATLRACGVARGVLSIVITDDESVRELNRTYRGMDEATDVLSFAAQDEAPGDLALPPEAAAEIADYLGDILIAYPYALRQAARFHATAAAELRLLVVHGTLHLLGYDHDTAEAEAEMWALQDAILAPYGDQGLSQQHRIA